MGQVVCKGAVSLLIFPCPYSDRLLVARSDLSAVLPYSPLLVGRMKVLAGRKLAVQSCYLLGCLQLKSMQMCHVVLLAGRMKSLAGRKQAGWEFSFLPADLFLLA